MQFTVIQRYGGRFIRLSSVKILQVMKLLVLFIVTVMQVAAKPSDAQDVTLSGNNLSLEKIFQEISKQTDYQFLYRNEFLELAKPVNIHVLNVPVTKALDLCFEGQPFTYMIVGKTITIRHKPRNLPPIQQPPPPQIEILGTVVDSLTGNPLVGVTVQVKGGTTGTTTEANGKFTLSADEQSVLIVSYLGYARKEVPVQGRTNISIRLSSTSTSLDRVIVTALGIKRESKSLGYATTEVKTTDLTENRTPKFMNALEGKVPGVSISSLGSGPGGSTKIRIRGQSSLGGENSPLIVVNGVPIDNSNFGVRSGLSGSVRGDHLTVDGGDGLSSIDPENIESMTILKGAAASALYGSRAKDGVIMITTKSRGSKQGIELSYNLDYSIGMPQDYTDYQYQYGQGENGERPTKPNPTSGVWSFGEKFQPGMTQVLFDSVVVPYTPQRHQVTDYYRNATNISNTVSLAYGGENGGFNLSLSNSTSQSILPGSKFNRKGINLGFTQTFKKKLTISGNINYSNEENKNPANVAEQDYSPVVIYTLATSMPLYLLKQYATDENGDEYPWSRFTDRTNPYFALTRFDNITKDRVYGNVTARYDFTDWLYLQGRIGQDFYVRDQDYNLPNGAQRSAPAPAGFVNGQYVQDARRFRELNMDFLIGAEQTFNDFGVNLNIGGNQMRRFSDRHNVFVQDFYTRGLYTIGNGRQVSPIYDISKKQVNSLYGTLGLSYKGFLFLNGTARNDWFSTLSPAERSILYPSVSASFVFSQAFRSVLPDWLTFGQVRVSYAEVGSDTDVPPYSNQLNYLINAQQFPDPAGVPEPLGGISGSVVPNRNLKPMREKEAEVGLKMEFLDNAFGFDISYYNKLSTDQIVQAEISTSSGFQDQLINAGESRNRGIEMLFTASPLRRGALTWDMSINASYNITRVLNLGGALGGTNSITVGTGDFAGELRQEVGKEMNQLYGYGYLRDSLGRIVFDPSTGLYYRSTEQLNFGSALPKWVGGISNTFHYKGVMLSFLIDFSLGGKLISGTHINAYREGLDKGTLPGREQGYVIGDGVNPDGKTNTAQAPVQKYYENIRTLRTSEQSVFNSGFWEFRQLNIGYDFTKYVSSLPFISGLKLGLVIHNVALLKKWVPHVHPEQIPFESDNMMGLESTGLPITRNIGFNLDVKF